MFRSICWGRVVPLALLAVLALCGAAVAATTPAIGVVDYQTIYDKYDAVKPATEALQAYYKKVSQPLDAMREGIGLSADDMRTFQDLYRLGEKNRTADQKKQFDDLSAKAKSNYGTYQALSEKKKGDNKLTDDESKKFTELSAQIDPVAQSYESQAQGIQDKVTAEKQRLQSILSKNIDDAVSKVAKQQKFNLILNKDVATAQGEMEKIVVWNDDNLDITDKVLTILNDDYKQHPTIFDAPPAPVAPVTPPAPAVDPAGPPAPK